MQKFRKLLRIIIHKENESIMVNNLWKWWNLDWQLCFFHRKFLSLNNWLAERKIFYPPLMLMLILLICQHFRAGVVRPAPGAIIQSPLLPTAKSLSQSLWRWGESVPRGDTARGRGSGVLGTTDVLGGTSEFCK